MHIVQLLPELQEGGVERGVVEMNRELVRRGVTSTVISHGGRLVAEIEAAGGRHIALDVCSKNPLTAPLRAWRLRRALAELQPDLVHVRSRAPAWLLRMANRTLHLPVVSTVHGFNSVSTYSRIMTSADRVICVSHAICQHLQRYYGASADVLRVIHRGIDSATFDPAHLDAAFLERFRREHALSGRFVATSIGRVTPLKDYETFIRGVAAARQEVPNLVGVIAGGTRGDRQGYEARLHALVRDLGMDQAIHFVGSQQAMAEVYAVSDVVVSCSAKPESFGRTLTEALAMNRPVIATAQGGALEIVREGENGLLFPPGDAAALGRCLVAASRRSFTGLRADVLARFSLETMVDRTLAVYREVLERPGAEVRDAPMHVVQLLPALQEGGVERGVVEMNRELVRRGVTSTVISHGGRLVAAIEADGGRHFALDVCSKNPLTAPRRARQLRQVLAKLHPDLVHVRSRVPAWLLQLANRSLRLPVVSTVHGFNRVNAYSRIMTQADHVICSSPAICAHIMEHYGTPETALRLVPRGIDPLTFDPARVDLAFARAFRTRYGMDGRYLVLGLGRITPWKGYDTLLRAAALARLQMPNLGVVIAGGVQAGQERYARKLRRLAEALGLDGCVVFCGSQSQVPEILHACDLLVSCAHSKPETFGRSMAEALAMERPVVAARHGGALDIVRDGQNGLLFTPGDAEDLARCLVAASRRTFTGLRADVLTRFSLDAMVERTLAVYREVLAGRTTAP